MKRKRGNVKPKPKRPSLVRASKALPNVVAQNTDYSLEDVLREYDAPMDTETLQGDTNLSDQQASLDEQVVANERTEENVNSLRNMNVAVLCNLSKLAASKPTKSSRGAGTCAEYDSMMEIETLRAETNLSGQQTDLQKGAAAANGMMGICPNALREMIVSIISELSEGTGGITAKRSSGNVDNLIPDAPVFQPQGDRTHQEKPPNQRLRYDEQELKASFLVIKKIMKLDLAEPFSVPVDPIALGIPDYFDVIDTPMDFGTICNNLEDGLKYMNSDDVYKDVQTIWENCCKYNKKGDYILELMKHVKRTFMKYWTAAGLYKQHHEDTDGSTMVGSKLSKECPGGNVVHVSDEVGASHVQIHQPSSSYNQAFQPHLSYNEPRLSLQSAGANASRFTHLQLPVEPNMKHGMKRHDCPLIPGSDKIGSRPAQSPLPSTIDNQPQLSLTQPQPSRRHTEVNTSSAGYSHLNLPTVSNTRHNRRQQDGLVAAVADSTGPSQVPIHGRSPIDNQPQFSSNYPQHSHRQVDVNTATAASSVSSLRPMNHGKECQVPPFTENLVYQQNKVGSSQEQSHQPSSYPQACQPQLRPDLPPSPLQHDDAFIDPTSMQLKRQGRGPTRCLNLLTALGRIPVSINELGQPIGSEAARLTSFLGLMARDGNIAPLIHPNWSKVPKENKETMWQKVQSKFEIDPSSRSWVLKSLGKKWRNFKSQLKTTHYDIYSTDAERLADRDTRVLPDQWPILVKQWSSEKWQQLSAKNKASRANQKFIHTTGKKSFARIREEEKAKRPDGKEPSRAELFILTRTRKDGQPVNEETAAVISQLRERAAQQPEAVQNNCDPRDDVLSQVLGPDKNGSVRLYGLGPCSSALGAQNPSRGDAVRMVSEANAKVHEMKDKMVSMEQTCTQMAAQMATMMSMMASMQKGSPERRTANVVADSSDDSEDVPQQSVRTRTSRRTAPSTQTKSRRIR